MSTTFATTGLDAPVATRPTLWKAGLVSGAIAAVATTVVAAVARAADVSLAIGGEQIPLLGFGQLTMVGALIGLAIAKVLSKRADRPQRTFVVTTVVLTALSLIPDITADTSNASKLVLMLTHVVASAIVIPTLANRLQRTR
jgi:hypothetical protein